MTFSNIYKVLSTPEKDGTKIGLFRIVCAIFGGLLVSYGAMTLLVLLIPTSIDHAMIIPFLFTPLVWACTALWISLSPTRLSALMRVAVPSILFTLGILFFI